MPEYPRNSWTECLDSTDPGYVSNQFEQYCYKARKIIREEGSNWIHHKCSEDIGCLFNAWSIDLCEKTHRPRCKADSKFIFCNAYANNQLISMFTHCLSSPDFGKRSKYCIMHKHCEILENKRNNNARNNHEALFEVEEILEKKTNNATTMYLIKWLGNGNDCNTWVDETQVPEQFKLDFASNNQLKQNYTRQYFFQENKGDNNTQH